MSGSVPTVEHLKFVTVLRGEPVRGLRECQISDFEPRGIGATPKIASRWRAYSKTKRRASHC